MKLSVPRRNLFLLAALLAAVVYGTAFVADNTVAPVRETGAWEGPKAYLRSLQSKLHDALTERRYDECELLIRRILKLAPENRSMQRAAGKIYYQNGKLNEAENILRSLLLRHPDDLLCRNNYAMVLLARGRREALPELKKALDDSGNSEFIVENYLYAGRKLGVKLEAPPAEGAPQPLFPVPPLDAITVPEEKSK
ncbi:MAG: hypothetical protein IJT50_14805 [Lentisphaeria bacterium]|nr:hypothetical protein [Lentisphaeria bacterium]